MIVNRHPILKLLDECEWKLHLVGSRYVGVFDRDRSDYDFILECEWSDWHKKVKSWLIKNGFVTVGEGGYGPDRKLHGTNVWTNELEGFPSVDILPMSPEEAKRRLRFFRAMKKAGDSTGGMLAKFLKGGKVWSNLWQCLEEFENLTNEKL